MSNQLTARLESNHPVDSSGHPYTIQLRSSHPKDHSAKVKSQFSLSPVTH